MRRTSRETTGRAQPRAAAIVLALGVAGLLALSPASAAAGPTDPTLVISDAFGTQGALRVLAIVGTFPSDDLVQSAYPLQLLVRSQTDGVSYVRFGLSDRGYVGMEPALADGLDASDVPGLLAAGTPDTAAVVVGLDPTRVTVVLPPGFPAGSVEVQFFVLEPGETVPVLSNAFLVTLGGQP